MSDDVVQLSFGVEVAAAYCNDYCFVHSFSDSQRSYR